MVRSEVAVLLIASVVSLVRAAPPNPCHKAHMPNNDNPYTFYKCDAAGKPHLWRCPTGTMYDKKMEICDWEDQVRARMRQNLSAGGAERVPGYNNNGGQRPNRLISQPLLNSVKMFDLWRDLFSVEGSGRGTNDKMDCSSNSNDSWPRLYQNPDDCSTYYTCNMGRPVLTYCIRGYNFNPVRQGCDTSTPAGCRSVLGAQNANNVAIFE